MSDPGTTSPGGGGTTSNAGFCMWQWNGSDWDLLQDGDQCGAGYYPKPPLGDGHHIGEQRMGTCAIKVQSGIAKQS